MTRFKLFAVIALTAAFAATFAIVAEAHLGATRYRLNGVAYAVPHRYEFNRQFHVWWLEGLSGFDREPDESVWLLVPARELSRDVESYKLLFHGYSGDVEANMVVNVLGGKEAREFPDDYAQMWSKVAEEEKRGAFRQRDQATGWVRVVWLDGKKGTPGEGHSIFYLIPQEGQAGLPNNWLPPSCTGSPDMSRQETYECSFVIHQDGLTFYFSLRQENLAVAGRIPAYIKSRLEDWRPSGR